MHQEDQEVNIADHGNRKQQPVEQKEKHRSVDLLTPKSGAKYIAPYDTI
jgi:hypothetical protein